MVEQYTFTAPSISAKCRDHVESIQQGPRRPDLSIPHPPLLDPVHPWRYPAQQREKRSGRSRSFAFQESRGENRAKPAANSK